MYFGQSIIELSCFQTGSFRPPIFFFFFFLLEFLVGRGEISFRLIY